VRRLFISRGSIVEAAAKTIIIIIIIIISINTNGRKDRADTRRERPSLIYTTKPDDAAAVLLTQSCVCVRVGVSAGVRIIIVFIVCTWCLKEKKNNRLKTVIYCTARAVRLL